jgi:hypothetical protein
LRDPEINRGTAEKYLKNGFTVHLHILAVHELVSRSRIFQRYFDADDDNSSAGRYTPRYAHDRSYNVLPESVSVLIDSSCFKTVTLYDQNQKLAGKIDLQEKDARQIVLSVLEKYRDARSVDSAEVLREITRLLPQAKQHGGAIYSDLLELHKTICSIGKHFIPNVPISLNETMQDSGCIWDAEHKMWYHHNPETAGEANRLVKLSAQREQRVNPALYEAGNDFDHDI